MEQAAKLQQGTFPHKGNFTGCAIKKHFLHSRSFQLNGKA